MFQNLWDGEYSVYTSTLRSETSWVFRIFPSWALVRRRIIIEGSILDTILIKLIILPLSQEDFVLSYSLGQSAIVIS